MFKQLIALIIFTLINFPAMAQVSQHKLEHDEVVREYRLFIPDSYDSNETGHLIMILHGGGMTAMEMIQETGQRFNQLVDENNLNVVVVYPQGVGRGWNDGRIREGQIAYDRGVDDVDFLLHLAETLADDYNIEADELFLTGFSNGAGMSYRVACEQPERVTAIVPVSNMIASTFDCEPASAVAVLSIMGDTDPILPLSGGDIFYIDDTPLGSVLSLEDTLTIWHTANQCAGYGARIDLPDIDPEDGTTLSIQHATECEQPLSSLIIHGGGHTWAGSLLYTPEALGITSHDMDAGEFIFDFFVEVGLGNRSE